MKIFGASILHDFKLKHTDCRGAIDSWVREVQNEKWTKFYDIKKRYATVSNIGNQTIIFNIKGNRYRLKIKVNYQQEIVLVQAIGTHAEYSKW